jgi:putative glutamine amidotransferase
MYSHRMERDHDRPRILVTCWRRPLPTYLGERTVLDTLDPAYAARVSDAGGLPLVLSRPPGDPARVVEEVLALADGLLVTGGGDVDPASYGADAENVDDPDAGADDWELALINAARERALPTLGICRGAQLLAVAHGGRLAQRLSAGDGHRDLGGLAPHEILSARHPLELVAGSRVARALGGDERQIAVNTIHHHEIADAGELEVTATAPGGLIEAVEARSEWACVGVQWHPEKMSEPEQTGLFAQLVGAARERSAATNERSGVSA